MLATGFLQNNRQTPKDQGNEGEGGDEHHVLDVNQPEIHRRAEEKSDGASRGRPRLSGQMPGQRISAQRSDGQAEEGGNFRTGQQTSQIRPDEQPDVGAENRERRSERISVQKIRRPPGRSAHAFPSLGVVQRLGGIGQQFLIGRRRVQPEPPEHGDQSRRETEHENQAAVHRYALQVPSTVCREWRADAGGNSGRPADSPRRDILSFESKQIDVVASVRFPDPFLPLAIRNRRRIRVMEDESQGS